VVIVKYRFYYSEKQSKYGYNFVKNRVGHWIRYTEICSSEKANCNWDDARLVYTTNEEHAEIKQGTKNDVMAYMLHKTMSDREQEGLSLIAEATALTEYILEAMGTPNRINTVSIDEFYKQCIDVRDIRHRMKVLMRDIDKALESNNIRLFNKLSKEYARLKFQL
jgi:uncharacterized protein YpiB (UPF0302 family)